MGTWAVVGLIVALAVVVGVLAWLLHLADKLRRYVLQAGEATRLLSAASKRALAEFPIEPAEGKRKAAEPSADELWARDARDELGPGAKE